ncbi:hypothetical protein KIW84_050005 [Lathyrus oleraceus]|uniref:Uncharacterized protein n=1 Tax=Pisum sativum TaxID=3888 RepID=A0A9D4WIL3_PEA|nr:hypothetical protein KIW84_050005 [Pisum sativum]
MSGTSELGSRTWIWSVKLNYMFTNSRYRMHGVSLHNGVTTAMCHGQLYQQRVKKAFDKKVKPRVFRDGDLVLKKVLSFAPDSRDKWTPNYEGSYVVKRAFSGGALMLTTMDGEDFTRPVNSDAVKKYFA